MSSSIHQEIERLQRKAALIDYANTIIENPFPIKDDITASSEVQAEVLIFIKESLKDYIKIIEAEQGEEEEEQAPPLSAEEVSKLKFLASRLDEVESRVAKSGAQQRPTRAVFTQTNDPEYAPEHKPQPQQQPLKPPPFKPLRALLMDTTYITNVYGDDFGKSVNVDENGRAQGLVHPDMMIMIIDEQDDETFIGEIIGRRGTKFPVPKDCVQILTK